tara:strand:+ start:129 stop:887 length:759 start_codon:yes stop_codon:yes gene_type:complete
MPSNGKVAVVTGAGTGVGKSATLHLLSGGYSVVLAGRRLEPLQEVVSESGVSGSKAIILPTDIGNPKDVEKLFNLTNSTYGRLDVLFNNAGISAPRVPFEDLLLEDWQKVVDTNLTGSFLCSQQAIRIMKNQTPMGGRIINNGSIAAYAPRPDGVAYTSTKHAISGLTKQISLDGRKYNIASSQIDIGNASTPMTAQMKHGVPQPNGDTVPEPTFDVNHVGETVLYIANLPLETNIQFMTIMATKMPFIGRG